MREIEVKLTGSTELIPQKVEQLCLSQGLRLTLKGTLAKYPGCIHWHFKNGRAPGTLEVTWLEQAGRLWFKVSAGRDASWIDEVVDRLQEQL